MPRTALENKPILCSTVSFVFRSARAALSARARERWYPKTDTAAVTIS